MKCDELKKQKYCQKLAFGDEVYLSEQVDEAIAELKARIQLDDDEMAGFLQLEEECGGGELRKYIAELKDKIKIYEDLGSCKEGCPALRHNQRRVESEIYKAELKDNEIKELKAKLEDAKASHYAEMVDAGMRERRLRRALWLARAERAKDRATTCNDFAYLGDTEREINMTLARTWMKCRMLKPSEWSKVWNNVERKCRAKAEEYK